MRDLVDGDVHEAWLEAAAGLLHPEDIGPGRQLGLRWQQALR